MCQKMCVSAKKMCVSVKKNWGRIMQRKARRNASALKRINLSYSSKKCHELPPNDLDFFKFGKNWKFDDHLPHGPYFRKIGSKENFENISLKF